MLSHSSMTRSRTLLALRLTFSLSALISCASAGGDGEETAQGSSAQTSAMFVGCRPSAGECSNSCADHRSTFLDADARCPGAGDSLRDTGACLCGERPSLPLPPPRGTFVGCRPSAGECMMSCPTGRGTYVDEYEECPGAGDPSFVRGGCFCN